MSSVHVLKFRKKWTGEWRGRDAPFVPTPYEAIPIILSLAKPKPGEVLYDLGCGDGRIIVEAAKRFDVEAVGIEIDPKFIDKSRKLAVLSGVRGKVEIIRGDLKHISLKGANIVYIYLTARLHNRLAEKLSKELKRGARVITYAYPIKGWVVKQKIEKNGQRIYLYKIPGSCMT
ncbi:SAM-dependent methyltransferase [Candidatus Geothermarchaeota archaeon]|nr:MAG: SAM-dependent methyltransferase [Candidatus Geothermarchaeota archaeon]